MSKRLTPLLKDLLEKSWSEFVEMENDLSHTSSQAVVFSLIRACQERKLPAIRESLDRIDGKIAVQIEVEYPKFYYIYPSATSVEKSPTIPEKADSTEDEKPNNKSTQEERDSENTHSLRYTLNRMSEEPRALVKMVLEGAKEVDVAMAYKGDIPQQDPKVKAVIVAGLLDLAHKGNMAAAFEILDQIDGKVAEKVKLLGEDMYIIRHDAIAPAGAYKNKEGVYVLEAENTTSSWAAALERSHNSEQRRFGK